MKKLLLVLSSLAMMFTIVQCSSTGLQAPDPKVVACKASCDTVYDDCIKKAGKNNAKKTGCETAKQKCYSECEKK